MNVFQYSANEQAKFSATLMELGGYETITTFFGDLSIAEWYGKEGILETHKNVCENWIGDYKFFTEYVMALNHKCFEHYDAGKMELSKLYEDLYYKAASLYEKKWSKNQEAMSYYYRVTD